MEVDSFVKSKVFEVLQYYVRLWEFKLLVILYILKLGCPVSCSSLYTMWSDGFALDILMNDGFASAVWLKLWPLLYIHTVHRLEVKWPFCPSFSLIYGVPSVYNQVKYV
ncbi:hypothetical protein RchiOBHm_Chr6g0271851 [Rosa chinensis]|uniref:Uncharacterized protein n=1 Tax=Rosa chinensis TaxID=74649 RepID=A0A2P6PR39_ROSCH|nr:hypothetical protein RchiOBHm_Chr6g0271851 [Rosa chinensis]